MSGYVHTSVRLDGETFRRLKAHLVSMNQAEREDSNYSVVKLACEIFVDMRDEINPLTREEIQGSMKDRGGSEDLMVEMVGDIFNPGGMDHE